jgi:hypothetical protein
MAQAGFGNFATGLMGGLEAGQRLALNQQKMRYIEEERQRELENRKALEGFVDDPMFGAPPAGLPTPQGQIPSPATLPTRGLGAGQPPPAVAGAPAGARASLIQNESGGNWQAKNDVQGSGGRGHFGRLQFSQGRMQDYMNATGERFTPDQFMSSPELQQRVESWHFNDIDQFVKQRGLEQFANAPVAGIPMTPDAMRAVAHLGGKGGLERFLTSGGQYNPADANGTRLSDYASKHGGIDPRMADVSGQPSPAVSPHSLPGRPVGAQMAERVQPYAQKYMEGMRLMARDPKMAAQLEPMMQQLKARGMSEWLSQFDGDISTMAGAHQLVVHAANGAAMFGEMPDLGALYGMAKDREGAALDNRRLAIAEQGLGMDRAAASETSALRQQQILAAQLENDVSTRTQLMEMINSGQTGAAKDFAKQYLGIEILSMEPTMLPVMDVELPTVQVTYRDQNGQTQTVIAAEVLYKSTLQEAALKQMIRGGAGDGEASYKFTAGERAALNDEILNRVEEACVSRFGGQCNAEQAEGLRREIEPMVLQEAQRFMGAAAAPADAGIEDDLFGGDTLSTLDRFYQDEY